MHDHTLIASGIGMTAAFERLPTCCPGDCLMGHLLPQRFTELSVVFTRLLSMSR